MNILTCNNLIAMGRHIPTPFYLAIMDDSGESMLKIETILRIVPGKRIVAMSHWKDQTVLVKLFFRRGHWKQNMLRDLTGLTLLRQATIPTPKIFSQTATADKHGAVLFIEYLTQGTSLLTMFDSAHSDEEQISIVEMGIEAIARCHRAGLWQKDIHLDNFMLSNGKVYVLDGGDIKGEGGTLHVSTCLQNLAVFFAQFPAALDIRVPQFLARYQALASTLTDDIESLLPEMTNMVVASRRQRLKNYERKLFRSTTANRQIHTANRFAVYDRSIHSDVLEKFIQDPDSLLVKGTMLKEGNSSTVAMIQFDGKDFVLKRYNIKGFWHGLKRLLQPSRAAKSWQNASVLEMLGVATPHPYAMIEERVLWILRRRAWFLCEYINDENLMQQIERDGDRFPMAAMLDRFKSLFATMQIYKISHGDMKASNFIYRNEHLFVLDLDAMQRHRSGEKAARFFRKDLERFRRNWVATRFDAAVQQTLSEFESAPAT